MYEDVWVCGPLPVCPRLLHFGKSEYMALYRIRAVSPNSGRLGCFYYSVPGEPFHLFGRIYQTYPAAMLMRDGRMVVKRRFSTI